jgi:hypothetical protein
MLRITRAAGPVLKLEGRLVGPWVDELGRACGAVVPPARLCLDLTAVTFADEAGARLLRELRQRGAVLTGCSGYVAVLLEGKGT